MIDIINRADKRGFIDSVNNIKQLKELRNLIAHEYADDNLKDIYFKVMNSIGSLNIICSKTIEYCNRFKDNSL